MFRAVSLFCGCGGMDLGFAGAGFAVVRAIDLDPAAAAVHAANFGAPAVLGDVTGTDFAAWRRELGPVDVVLGGFPCQGFSKAGPKRADDPRNGLYRAMLGAVRELRPACFVAENVEGLAQNFGGRYLEQISGDFGALGYQVAVALIDAIGYGVPQHRRRIFFVGTAAGMAPAGWPQPSCAVRVRNGETGRPRSMPSALHGLLGPDRRPELAPPLRESILQPSESILQQNGTESSVPASVAAGSVVGAADVLAGTELAVLAEPAAVSAAIGDLRSLDAPVPGHEVLTGWPARYEAIIKAIGPGQKLCNVRHGPESVRTWDIPQAFGPVTAAERDILEAIARNRRHRKYGTIPNGNPLPVPVIEELTGQRDLGPVLDGLCQRGFAKALNGGYDLRGGLFCSGQFRRPAWDAPAPTVLTGFGNPRYFLHPLEDRPFSLREAARLQGFPDTFVLRPPGVPLPDAFRLVGNAVPPPLARALAGQVAAALAAR
jgi:DNA (cytosine-5)-methyltransferase 1